MISQLMSSIFTPHDISLYIFIHIIQQKSTKSLSIFMASCKQKFIQQYLILNLSRLLADLNSIEEDLIISYPTFTISYQINIMYEDNQVKCPGCGELLSERDFRSHIRSCSRYPGFALKQIRLLKSNIPTLELKMIITELDLCRQIVEELLQEKLEQNKRGRGERNSFQIKKNENPYMMEEEPPEIDMSAFSQQIVKCMKCQKKFFANFDIHSLFYVYECWHLFCKTCVVKAFDQDFVNNGGNLTCLARNCKNNISEDQLRQLVGEKKYETGMMKGLRQMCNLVECVKCKNEFQYLPGKPSDAPKKDNNGKALTEENKAHYAENRFVCIRPDCKTQQCKACRAIPYHVGMTCKAFQERSQMKKCRYCDEPITEKNKSNTRFPALADICNAKECQDLSQRACTKIHPCGHPCGGVRDELKCLPCLREPCCEKNQELNGQNGDDYCNVCFIEALNAAPCVRSTCGHVYHQKCLKKRYQIKWLTPRIMFNFCLCPLCKKWINLPDQNPLMASIKYNLDLYTKIQSMSFQRLKFEECLKDEKLTDPKSPYYQKPNEYAMAIYAYFMCFKCKGPYFGGRKNCAQAMNEPQNQGQFKPEQLICPNCCDIPIQNCAKHGKDFIEFKCKFCCSTAQWFCWGNTHFCQPCHKRQCNGDYVSKYTKDKLPKCQGPGKCPVGGNHNGNGEEKTLGCAICRNFKQNSKNF